MSTIRQLLEDRKKDLQEKIKPLKALETELKEVETLLTTLDRPQYGGWETPGHPPGCRCYPDCDPSR